MGKVPFAALIFGSDGNLYGTTGSGGTSSNGTIFRITTGGVETVLYSFSGGSAGGDPGSALLLANDGNFYGVTHDGGTANGGAIYKMTPGGAVSILHNFQDGSTPDDGIYPGIALIQAADGNFYGETNTGGSAGDGTIYRMTPGGTVTIMHSFEDGTVAGDGGFPEGGLIQATDGNFYGSTNGGFGPSADGTIFRMTPSGTVTNLHVFGSIADDGDEPYASLVQGSDGDLYGTTLEGGTPGTSTPRGTVFVLNLNSPPDITSASSTAFVAGQAGTFTFHLERVARRDVRRHRPAIVGHARSHQRRLERNAPGYLGRSVYHQGDNLQRHALD